jgi:predicted ATPase
VKRIVISGGPCAGKTSVIEALREHFPTGINFFPEAATKILSSGYPRPDRYWRAENYSDFQRKVILEQLSYEEVPFLLPEDQFRYPEAPVHIFDRCLIDSAAYPGGFLELVDAGLWEGIGDRYDLVIYISSLAIHQPHLYSRSNNVARLEDAYDGAQACIRLLKIMKSVVPTNKLVILQNDGTLPELIEQVKKLVTRARD